MLFQFKTGSPFWDTMYIHSNKPVHSWDRIHLVLALSVDDDDGDAYDDVDDYADCLLTVAECLKEEPFP